MFSTPARRLATVGLLALFISPQSAFAEPATPGPVAGKQAPLADQVDLAAQRRIRAVGKKKPQPKRPIRAVGRKLGPGLTSVNFCRRFPSHPRCRKVTSPVASNFCRRFPSHPRCRKVTGPVVTNFCRRFPSHPTCRKVTGPVATPFCRRFPSHPACRRGTGPVATPFCRRHPHHHACRVIIVQRPPVIIAPRPFVPVTPAYTPTGPRFVAPATPRPASCGYQFTDCCHLENGQCLSTCQQEGGCTKASQCTAEVNPQPASWPYPSCGYKHGECCQSANGTCLSQCTQANGCRSSAQCVKAAEPPQPQAPEGSAPESTDPQQPQAPMPPQGAAPPQSQGFQALR